MKLDITVYFVHKFFRVRFSLYLEVVICNFVLFQKGTLNFKLLEAFFFILFLSMSTTMLPLPAFSILQRCIQFSNDLMQYFCQWDIICRILTFCDRYHTCSWSKCPLRRYFSSRKLLVQFRQMFKTQLSYVSYWNY